MRVVMSAEAKTALAKAPVPGVDSSPETKLLPVTLSLTAGCVDVISFLGFGGLFAAHITGNLVIMASHFAVGGPAGLSEILSVPVFIGVLASTRVLAVGLEALRMATLGPLLLLQLALLATFCMLAVSAPASSHSDTVAAVFAGMTAVAAMAVQNALAQVSLEGAPATAVMTTNITRFVADIGTIMLRSDAREIGHARARAKYSGQAIVGFAVGCAVGAVCQSLFGMWSTVVPAGIALLAVVLGYRATRERGGGT
jgi:uncharacterized membrane protein YoaK (UPF0700 family)